MRLRYRIPLAVVAIMLVATMFLGSSYALWRVTEYQETANVIESGCFKVEFSEQSSSINLKNTYPVSDEKGLATAPYVFTIKNTCTVDAEYTVYLNTLAVNGTKIDDSLIKYSFNKSTDSVAVANPLNTASLNTEVSSFTYDKNLLTSYSLATGLLKQNQSVQYNLRLWIDESATTSINGQKFEAGIASVAYATTVPICKRATTLHDNFGSLGTNGILASGDAFDCDVNGDGKYNSTTERFYYVSDYYDTETGKFSSDYATLVYYSNVGTVSAYDLSGVNSNGPITAKEQLPTTSQWNNVNLKKTIRIIRNETGNVGVNEFNYGDKAARLLTYQEVYAGCYDGTNGLITASSLISKCKYLLENTVYSGSSNAGYWIESPVSSNTYQAWDVNGYSHHLRITSTNVDLATTYKVRPVIDVLKTNIEY